MSTLIETLSESKKKSKISFVPWQDKIMEIVDNKIHFTSLKFKPSEPVSVLKDPEAMKVLKKLQNNLYYSFQLTRQVIMLRSFANNTMRLLY